MCLRVLAEHRTLGLLSFLCRTLNKRYLTPPEPGASNTLETKTDPSSVAVAAKIAQKLFWLICLGRRARRYVVVKFKRNNEVTTFILEEKDEYDDDDRRHIHSLCMF